MAAASSLLSEDQFLCSICLDVFTDPVTIPCGHNFCKSCITEHWDINVQCQCPLCNQRLNRRPKLYVNTFISEMAAQFRHSVQISNSSEQQDTKPGEVVCDVCTGTKPKALKSCLVCLASYCETHLEPHHRIAGLKKHKLIDPVENLEGRMCKKHERPLEMFCTTDQMCVCQFCTESDHKLHHIVPLKGEYERRKSELDKTEAEVQQMIQERRLKIEQIKQSVKLSEEDADRETVASVQVFTALIQSVERCLAQLIEIIAEKQSTTAKQAEGFIKELEEEISELLKRGTELEQLSHTEDHLQFLQNVPSLNNFSPTKDWTEVRVHSSCDGTVWTTLVQLEETLTKEVKNLCTQVELKTVQQFAVDVTLDSETANTDLILSDDRKQVNHGDLKQNLPDSPERFSSCCVLAEQCFPSGRFYYEVQVKEKTAWTLGVATESITRKGFFTLSPKNGHWTVCLMNGNQYKALAGPSIRLTLKSNPEKVGVFVDYEEGLVSFYDADAATHIYSFLGCNFTEKLYPYFNPCYNDGGKNSTPLIICPVKHTD